MWKYGWDIESSVFKTMYVDALHWGGADGIWEPLAEQSVASSPIAATKSELSFALSDGMLSFVPTQFKIFVNTANAERSHSVAFLSNFEPLETQWENTSDSKDITKVKVDRNDPYFASLIAAYIISKKSGICK